jgi:uncharacterized protein (TIGR03084 family)
MPVDMSALLADLQAETRFVDDLVGPLAPDGWDRPTPAAGWAIRDQISHLAYFDDVAVLALTDPDAFRAQAARMLHHGWDFTEVIARRYRPMPAAELLAWFRTARVGLVTAFSGRDPKTRLPWFGPDMSAASSVTARLMETWAHGQDVADAVGATQPASPRLRHIAHLGVGTFGFVFTINGRPTPTAPVRVELAAPDGDTWTWGPADAADRVSGPALDFCLVATQRRNLADTAVTVEGPVAREWMGIVQTFAGAPGPGRPPRTVSPNP